MTARAAFLTTLLAAAVLAGCGDSDEPERLTGDKAGAAATFEDACSATISADDAEGAGAPATGTAALVLAAATVRPGAQVQLLPVNRTDAAIVYGRAYTLERREGGTWAGVPVPKGLAFSADALTVSAGRTGPCLSALVETTAAEGRYRVTLPGSEPSLRGEFTVAGDPLPPSELEQSLKETAADPERETTVPRLDDPSGTGANAPRPGIAPVP